MIALLVAALLAQAPAAPPPEPVCKSTVEIVEMAQANGAALIAPMNQDAIDKAAEIFNQTPPATDMHFNEGLLVTSTNGAAIVFFGNDDKFCGLFLAMNRQQWQTYGPRIMGLPV